MQFQHQSFAGKGLHLEDNKNW